MEEHMSPAARVRRGFRLGRPPKVSDELLRPLLAVDKAETLLADFRQRMQTAGLNPEHVDAMIIGVRASNMDEPVFIPVERDKAISALSAPGIGALGCIFRQRDEGKNVDFFVQFTGLTDRALGVLKRAITMQSGAQDYRA